MGGDMLQAFVFDKLGVVVGDIYFRDPDPIKGQEGPEHGVRVELRAIGRGDPKGNIYAAIPIEVAEPVWRVDLLESVDGKPGSFDRTHHHPRFTGWDPSPRKFLRELSSDPIGWLEKELSDLPAVLERAGAPAGTAGPADADDLRDLAPAIATTAAMMLKKVRSGELGKAPAEDGDSIRTGWL